MFWQCRKSNKPMELFGHANMIKKLAQNAEQSKSVPGYQQGVFLFSFDLLYWPEIGKMFFPFRNSPTWFKFTLKKPCWASQDGAWKRARKMYIAMVWRQDSIVAKWASVTTRWLQPPSMCPFSWRSVSHQPWFGQRDQNGRWSLWFTTVGPLLSLMPGLQCHEQVRQVNRFHSLVWWRHLGRPAWTGSVLGVACNQSIFIGQWSSSWWLIVIEWSSPGVSASHHRFDNSLVVREWVVIFHPLFTG